MRPISSMKFNQSAPQQNWQALRLICERGAQAPLVVQTAFCRHWPKMVKGGRSATMMYAYAYSFCRRAVVATMDLSASGLHLLRSDHWLADERNVLQVWLDQPAWLHSSSNPLPRSDPRTLMQGWSVAQAVAFLHSVDLDGAAEVCRHNGVNGDDLLTMTAATLTGNLRISPFLAQKILKARDCYLDAAVM